jgi:hypothetical protein
MVSHTVISIITTPFMDMVKLQVLGNNSKTVNNIKNLTWIKMISTARSTYPAILK